jgi:hypothetical protein
MDVMTVPSTPPAGWYADPAGSGLLRYWSGDTWSEQLASPEQVATPEPAVEPTLEPVPEISYPSELPDLSSYLNGSHVAVEDPNGVPKPVVAAEVDPTADLPALPSLAMGMAPPAEKPTETVEAEIIPEPEYAIEGSDVTLSPSAYMKVEPVKLPEGVIPEGEDDYALNVAEYMSIVQEGHRRGTIRSPGLFNDDPKTDVLPWIFGAIGVVSSFWSGQQIHEAYIAEGGFTETVIFKIVAALLFVVAIVLLPAIVRRTFRLAKANKILGKQAPVGWFVDPTRAAAERYSDGHWTPYVNKLHYSPFRQDAMPFLLTLLLSAMFGYAGWIYAPVTPTVNVSAADIVAADWAKTADADRLAACRNYAESPLDQVNTVSARLASQSSTSEAEFTSALQRFYSVQCAAPQPTQS